MKLWLSVKILLESHVQIVCEKFWSADGILISLAVLYSYTSFYVKYSMVSTTF
jgi:hypothetical protein